MVRNLPRRNGRQCVVVVWKTVEQAAM